MSVWTGFNWLRVRNVRGLLFICGFHERLSNYQLDKSDSYT
jgi:hypothetical protein